MQQTTTRLRELTVRYTIRKDAYGRAVPIDRLLVTPSAAVDAFAQILAHEPTEVFGVLCLSTKRRVIAYHEVSRGTLDSTLVHPRGVQGRPVGQGCSNHHRPFTPKGRSHAKS